MFHMYFINICTGASLWYQAQVTIFVSSVMDLMSVYHLPPLLLYCYNQTTITMLQTYSGVKMIEPGVVLLLLLLLLLLYIIVTFLGETFLHSVHLSIVAARATLTVY